MARTPGAAPKRPKRQPGAITTPDRLYDYVRSLERYCDHLERLSGLVASQPSEDTPPLRQAPRKPPGTATGALEQMEMGL